MPEDLRPPYRIQFDSARDPYTARNAIGAVDTKFVADAIAAAGGGGGGNVSNSGTPTVGQYAKWVTATTIQGVAPATVLTDIGAQPAGSYQPLDADLTSIAALTGTNTIYYRSAANTWTAVTIGGNMTFSGGTLNSVAGGSGNVSNSGTPTAGQVAVWTDATHVQGVTPTSPTFQRFTSGSGTYTTPAGVKYIHVQMVGGGGGGGSGATGGGAGGTTTFGTLTATGGALNGVVPGSGSGADFNFDGGAGGTGGHASSIGGHGGNSMFGGGGGSGSSGVAARAASANTGGGGGGGGSFSGAASGAGGGAGGGCDHVFRTPAATYAYAVGAAGSAGAAGTNTNAGAAGAAGVILVREYY